MKKIEVKGYLIIMKKIVLTAVLTLSLALAGCGSTGPADLQQPAQTEGGQTSSLSDLVGGEDANDDTQNVTDAQPAENETQVVLDATPVDGPGASAENQGAYTAADFAITANGVTISLGDDFLPNVDAVGTADIQEGQACLEGGYDTNYYYGGEELVVYTVASQGQQIVYDIYVTSGDYKTAKGAQVGVTTTEDIYNMYGDPTVTNVNTQVFEIPGTTIKASFTFNGDGILESIDVIENEN